MTIRDWTALGLLAFTVALILLFRDQVYAMAYEIAIVGGYAASAAMYCGALITFITSVWFLWQSRLPENREGGRVAAGVAALILTGLLVTGGRWTIEVHAARTTAGPAACISSKAGDACVRPPR